MQRIYGLLCDEIKRAEAEAAERPPYKADYEDGYVCGLRFARGLIEGSAINQEATR